MAYYIPNGHTVWCYPTLQWANYYSAPVYFDNGYIQPNIRPLEESGLENVELCCSYIQPNIRPLEESSLENVKLCYRCIQPNIRPLENVELCYSYIQPNITEESRLVNVELCDRYIQPNITEESRLENVELCYRYIQPNIRSSEQSTLESVEQCYRYIQPNIRPSEKSRLESLELLKKVLIERTKDIKQAPKFLLRQMGENATLKVALNRRCPLFVSDIQHLLMYSQIGANSLHSPARWCSLEKYYRLSNVTLLIIENMSIYHYEEFENYFPFTRSNFDHMMEIISPFAFNSDIAKELSVVPLSGTQMSKLVHEHGSLEEAAKNCSEVFDMVKKKFPIKHGSGDDDGRIYLNGALPHTDKYSRVKLLLSGWQMIEENFPLPIKGFARYADYVLTKESYKPVTAHSPLIAIDCEMCKTAKGELELTRISVVDENHRVIYDTLVKPKSEIVDYLTKFSGINSKMMKNVTTSLRDVQEELRKLLPDDAILVGQSLSSDLHALKMMHPYVIDTSVIYNMTGDRSCKTKLQILAREFLKEKIQTGTQGHCSSEDSLACMKLVQLKLKKHLYYGDAVMTSIFTNQAPYPDMGTTNYAVSMLKQCVKAGNTVNVVGVDDLACRYRYYVNKNAPENNNNINCVKANSNKDVIKYLCGTMDNHNLNIGHLRIEENQLRDECTNKEKVFNQLDKWISEVHSAAKEPALVAVMLSGHRKGGNGGCFLHLKSDVKF